ncbi:phage terminase small subunit [Pelosinus sp. sgz500959]|uniref:phage terminase small subunit n=1 Tax=Pelosinus sp. sgz500959 TaxID=3242472 RepID=UPI00366A8C93
MARPRNPDRDRAFKIWRGSDGTARLKDIADEIGIPDSRIRKWKTEDKWDEKIKERSDSNKGALLNSNRSAPKRGAPKGSQNAKGHGAPKGNRNALGNKGGNGGPFANKNAVTTGEYESIWFDCLTEEEQILCNTINTDTLAQIEGDIRLITLRERRMMERIKKLIDGLTEKERKVLHELHVEKNPIEVYDEKTGKSKVVVVPEARLVITEVTETEYRKIDDILKVEEALTRVQEKKTRLLTLKNSVEITNRSEERQRLEIEKLKAEIAKLTGADDPEEDNSNNFLDALSGKVQEVWDNE